MLCLEQWRRLWRSQGPILMPWSPHVPDPAKLGMCIPLGVLHPPHLLSPLPPPQTRADWGSSSALVPLKILPTAPRNASLSESEFFGTRSNNRELWQRPAHFCEAVPSFSTNTARAGTARPCSSPAGPCGSLGTWVRPGGWGIPSAGESEAQKLREPRRIPESTAQPSDTPGWAGEHQGKGGTEERSR